MVRNVMEYDGWNIMSIVQGTSKGGVCKLCLTEKHFNNGHLLNKNSEFISKYRHENKLLVKSVEKGSVICFYTAVLFSFL